ncbi:potassium transporter TrkA [Geothrix oryzae]|uniref:Potassium transporter TrkA n=1 Tax=Geothrix oryzae TaxID=2927975 RepID=A0ABM8DU13_9BACT|nr:potassium channel protein [Geothrix oryzae]BDU70539.1 potassium transporter TrkA [Geothrix oryzae]
MRASTPFPMRPDDQQNGPVKRLRYTMALLAAVIACGGLGYHWLSHLNPLDSLYMAITTLFTVGFRELGEVNARTKLFTIFYLIVGLGVATYALSNLTALLLEGDLKGYIMERRMQKRLDDLKDHIIVCGFGKMGFQAAWELKKAGIPFVIIEQDDSKGRSPRFAGELILYGNAMDELMLERAGIRQARGLITALTTDADNVLVTLTVKQIRPDLPVVARSAKLGTERQLRAAGADHIVSPYEIGGRRMAGLLLKPEMMNFFDIVLQQEQLELGLERIAIAPQSALVGQTLREARLRHATGSLLVGLVHPGAGLRFNPSGDERFQAGDELLVMGPAEALENLTQLAKG